jgi:hypothetical protein
LAFFLLPNSKFNVKSMNCLFGPFEERFGMNVAKIIRTAEKAAAAVAAASASAALATG